MRHMPRTEGDPHHVGLRTRGLMREMHKGTLPAGASKGGDGDVPTVQEESVGHQAGLPGQLGY